GLAYPALGEHPIDEYLLGETLVVAPIVAGGVTSRAVTLPPGMWLDWWTGAAVTGHITATADLHTLPLYLAQGAIIPMLRPTIETLSPAQAPIDSLATDAGVLYVRIAPGPARTTFTLYDGTTIAQQPGS